MSLIGYQNSENAPEHKEPALYEVIAAVDHADTDLCMAYSRYLERPNSRREKEITEGTNDLFDAFGNLLRKAVHGSTQPLPENESHEESAAILATVLHNITENHSVLLADYTDYIQLPTEEERADSLLGLTEILQDDAEESTEALVDAALARLKGVCETDMEVIEIATAKKVWVRKELGKKALLSGGRIAQIAAGSAAGIVIAEKLLSR